MSPKYDMRVNPVYQVDCQISASGKWLSASKRRVRWRFGFAHRQSVEEGLVGNGCRGEEHDVVLVWSLISGKQLVLVDGVEVFFQSSARITDRMEASWTMKCGHEAKVIANATPSIFETEGTRQFDFLIDGLSFFDMPKIYQLGRPSAWREHPSSLRASHSNVHAYVVENDDVSLDFARKRESSAHASMPELPTLGRATGSTAVAPVPAERYNGRSKSMPEVDLLSDPQSGSIASTTPPTTDKQVLQLFPSPTSVLGVAVHDEFAPKQQIAKLQADSILNTYDMSNSSHDRHHQQQQQLHKTQAMSPSSLSTSSGAIAATSIVPFIPSIEVGTDSYSTQKQMLSPDGTASTGTSTLFESPTQDTFDGSIEVAYGHTSIDCMPPSCSNSGVSAANVRAQTLSMAPLEIRDLDARDDMTPMDRAMHSLVHLDDISKQVESPEHKRHMEQRNIDRPRKAKPLPPAKTEWFVAKDASLAEIHEHKLPKKDNQQPSKPVMRTHAYGPQEARAGTVVLYGTTQHGQPQLIHPSPVMMHTGY